MKDEEFKTTNPRALNDDALESVSGGSDIFHEYYKEAKRIAERNIEKKIQEDSDLDDGIEAF